MPQILSIADLETRCRERADMPLPDKFIGSDECRRYIQKSFEKLWNILVGKYENYFVKTGDEGWVRRYPDTGAGLVAGLAEYSFPEDFAKLVRFALAEGTRNRAIYQEFDLTRLFPLTFNEELAINPRQARGRPTHYIRYGRADNNTPGSAAGFRLVPTPDKPYLLDIKYVPRPPVLEQAGGDFIAGWDEYVVLDTVIKMLSKQESRVRELQEERDHCLSVIENAISPVDIGQPGHVEGAAMGIDAWDNDAGEVLFD